VITIKIIHGDSNHEMKKISDESVDCIVSDPPFGISFQSNMRTVTPKFNKIKDDDNLDNVFVLFSEMYRVLKPNTHIYLFCSWHHIDKFKIEFEKYFKLKNILIWNKGGFSMGDLKGSYATEYELILFGVKGKRDLNNGRHSAVLNYAKVPSNNLDHSTQKPVPLAKFLIEKSTNKGDVVLDCYAGTGFVPIACKQCYRDSIAIEIDEDYYHKMNTKLNQGIL